MEVVIERCAGTYLHFFCLQVVVDRLPADSGSEYEADMEWLEPIEEPVPVSEPTPPPRDISR